ncbi:helix-turn-helix domain-containing protein [Planctomicrobium sp. SH527]|uniref:helix-turn-helix domain-containing protein n=1 Tax=Planctomicrobium sp. SH527 TaxID=3448123 RepID=UPI003F5B3AB7
MNPLDRMLNVATTAERLGVSTATIYALVNAGKLPCYRIGVGRGAIRISEREIEQYLESCRQLPTAPTTARSPRPRRLKHIKI